ncbi:MAG TPA: hypothetical protein VHZ78_11080 [Rhizomicrobium sp.]|jgi:hypothetical protein|nr:hypothetical protein [Rhizomicrobium sp.]
MSAKAKIEISAEALAVAQKNANDSGFSSADAYIEALLLDDLDAVVAQPWFKRRIEEGLASPIVGELTPDRVSQLVRQGIDRANRRG